MRRADHVSTMAENGPPPDAAAALYPGDVMHARLKPFGHRFTYRVFSLLLDLDRLDEVGRMTPLMSVNRANLVSFHERDHTDANGVRLRDHADSLLAQAGLGGRPHRILLLAYPRILGYVFNPISVYFAYDRDGALLALIYSVRNTFGEKHAYVARVEPGDISPAGVRQSRSKLLHVSPFIGMDARYHFRILPPGKAIRLRIHETADGDPLLAATFSGEAEALTTRNLGWNLLRFPALTWKIMAGIHWEALKLWLKGARFHRSPPPPAEASHGDGGALPQPGE